MRQFIRNASGRAARPGLWFGLLVVCAAYGQPQPPPPRDPENIESMFSVNVFFWKPDRGTAGFRGGEPNRNPSIRNLDYPDTKPSSAGGVLTFPTGGFNRLEIGYFRVTNDGSVRTTRDVSIEGASVGPNTLVAMRYRLTSVRVSWNYLTFPVPPLDSRLRVKTFWELHFTGIKPQLTFPEIENSAPVQPDQSLFYPGIGLGFEYVPSRRFRLEARGSGMGFPNRSRYLDTEGTAVVRLGSVELFGGMKMYHFRTSPKNELYIKGTLTGPLFGVRYVFPK